MNFLKNLWARITAFVMMKPYTPVVSKPAPVVSRSITPAAPVQAKPTNQAEWDAYRASLPASTRAYVPVTFNPTSDAAGRPLDAGSVDTTPHPFPPEWNSLPLRLVVNLEALKVYSVKFKGGTGAVSVTPTAADPAGQSARYQVTVRSNGIPFTYGAPSSHKFVPFNVLPGDCSIDISSDVNSQAWLELK